MIRALCIAVAVLAVGFAATTYVALELTEVATVETASSDRSEPRQTRVWYVQHGDALYLEAGHPDNPWVRDLEHMRRLALSGEDIGGEYLFQQSSSAADHERIRKMMRGKYGWRDWWIGVVFDTSRSRLIKLESAK
ncbi:MAG: hypothetical protein E2O75_03195 [Chloroflexi bacterium]|nr:MAG: hypothetical protein E2O75_03195 [Chloroflexota bacterium]